MNNSICPSSNSAYTRKNHKHQCSLHNDIVPLFDLLNILHEITTLHIVLDFAGLNVS